MFQTSALLSTVLMQLSAVDADACGGFACAAARPVVQNAERVVFGLDEAHGEVEMHVQITYSGPSSDFSWIVPVPGEPELFLTSSALFSRIALATMPRFNLSLVEEGRCTDGFNAPMAGSKEMAMDAVASAGPPFSSSVSVVAQEEVGPYETVTLQAESSDALLAWLDANGYDIPANLDAALSPYIAHDAYFVALKLKKDSDTGDLAPLGLRYASSKAMVPVQLTSVSAAPDMRMEAYVFSNTRAVPESYLHVQINEAAINWWSNGSNYDNVITQAADEAGGHAFATDYYGSTDIINPIWDESLYQRADAWNANNYRSWIEAIRAPFLLAPTEALVALEDILDLPAGSGATAWSCPDCVDASLPFDPAAATLAFEARAIEPARTAQLLLDAHEKVSRMTSSLDAIEMTVDPIFVLNHDMHDDEVKRAHNADLVYKCGNGRNRSKANRNLVLPDGREIELPSEDDMTMSDWQYVRELGERKAKLIEQTGAEGKPVVIADFRDELFEQVRLFNRVYGYGCNTSTGRASLLAIASAMLLTARRR